MKFAVSSLESQYNVFLKKVSSQAGQSTLLPRLPPTPIGVLARVY
jgi:hypothetical protein